MYKYLHTYHSFDNLCSFTVLWGSNCTVKDSMRFVCLMICIKDKPIQDVPIPMLKSGNNILMISFCLLPI